VDQGASDVLVLGTWALVEYLVSDPFHVSALEARLTHDGELVRGVLEDAGDEAHRRTTPPSRRRS
jgi:hypothetical protein